MNQSPGHYCTLAQLAELQVCVGGMVIEVWRTDGTTNLFLRTYGYYSDENGGIFIVGFGGYCHVSLTLRLKGRDFYETLRRRGGILIRLNGQELLNFLRERLPGGFSAPIAFVEACCDTMYMKQAMEAWGMPTDGHALDEGVSTPT